VGFAPAESPRIAFAVFIEHGGHGGTTAAPVARRVLERFFSPLGEESASSAGRGSRDMQVAAPMVGEGGPDASL